jgi:hypothetical protein
MHSLRTSVKYDVARLQFYAIEYLWWIMMDRECNKDQVRSKRDIGDARQIFFTTHQAQMAKLHPSQASLKIPLGTENKVDVRATNIRSVIIRVGEFRSAAPLHSQLPQRQGEPK